VTAELKEVRSEDSFDVEGLHSWLLVHAPYVAAGGQPPTVRQFSGGASNLTYLLTYGDREYVLRRPPRGHRATSAHDMLREVTVQQRLRPAYPLVPQVHAYCADPSIIGDEFYVMSRVHGTILRRDLPPGVGLSPDRARELAFTVIDAQADLHSLDPEAVGLAELGKGPGYVARQVSGWSRRYLDARTDDVPDGLAVMRWLEAEQPEDCAQRLIHGDWRLDNLVLDLVGDPRITGVLDWEMATIGDPLMDVGASLAYWITAHDDDEFQLMRRQPTDLPGFPSRAEYVSRYLERTGLEIDDWRFYEVYGLFRLAVIAQQIWYRYRRAETTNPDFAVFGAAVTMLMNRAERATTAAG
jgi:aminoglycoside phosphotransferase (APT) family kinase protein